MSGINLFDRNVELLNANMNRRAESHGLISRNISNIDTPNYRGTGLEFEKQLRAAIDGDVLPTTMTRTNPLHMPYEDPGAFGQAPGVYKDTGPVHLDIEMSTLAENNIMFNSMVTLLNKKFSLLKTAIADTGGK